MKKAGAGSKKSGKKGDKKALKKAKGKQDEDSGASGTDDEVGQSWLT